jgi:hypothetical protein
VRHPNQYPLAQTAVQIEQHHIVLACHQGYAAALGLGERELGHIQNVRDFGTKKVFYASGAGKEEGEIFSCHAPIVVG